MKKILILLGLLIGAVSAFMIAGAVSIYTEIPVFYLWGGMFVGSIFVGRYVDLKGVLNTLVGTHTGSTSYSGTIESPVARILIFGDSATAVSTIDSVKLTLTQSTKRKTGTIIPDISLLTLGEIAAFIDGVIYEDATAFYKYFSIPISLGGAYDLEGGSFTYTLTGCTAGDTIKVYAVDDAKRELDYIDIVPVGVMANAVKVIDCLNGAFLFLTAAQITRIKINYPNGVSIEYVDEEIREIARCVNQVEKITLAGLAYTGFGTYCGVNVIDAVSVEVNMTTLGTVYLVKHMDASQVG
jgi:hypothetical protein